MSSPLYTRGKKGLYMPDSQCEASFYSSFTSHELAIGFFVCLWIWHLVNGLNNDFWIFNLCSLQPDLSLIYIVYYMKIVYWLASNDSSCLHAGNICIHFLHTEILTIEILFIFLSEIFAFSRQTYHAFWDG